MNTSIIHIQCPHCQKDFSIKIPKINMLQKQLSFYRAILKAKKINYIDPYGNTNTYGKYIDYFINEPILPEKYANGKPKKFLKEKTNGTD